MHFDFLIPESRDDRRFCRYLKSLERVFVVIIVWVDAQRDSGTNTRTVRDHFPVIGSHYTTFVWCFQVGLIEAREDNVAKIWLKISESVLCTVCIVFEVVESLAIVNIEAFELDDSTVETDFLMAVWNVDAVVAP